MAGEPVDMVGVKLWAVTGRNCGYHGVSRMNEDSQDREVLETLGMDHVGGRKRRWGLWISVGVVAVLILGTVIHRAGRPDGPRFRTEKVEQGKLVVTVTTTGTIEPVDTVQVGAEISGRIDEVRVDYNDQVKKGDVLAVINTDQLEARVHQSEAALESAKASVRQAEATAEETKVDYQRQADMAARKLVSQKDLDAAKAAAKRAEAALAVARSQVTVATANLAADRTNLDKAVIRAPISGIVISRNVEPGQTVAATFQTPVLFELAADLKRMELHVDIDEADIGQVKAGQHAMFTVDAYPDKQFPATIESLRNAAKTVDGVVTYEGILTVDNSEGLLRPGMTATAEITTAVRDNAITVPNAALRFTPPEAAKSMQGKTLKLKQGRVWMLADGKPKPLVVETGITDGVRTEILGGPVNPGMELLTDIIQQPTR